MKKIIWLFLLTVLVPSFIFSEVVKKVKDYPDSGWESVYYSKGKKIAKEIFDKDGNIIKRTGKIPDGIVKEYYQNGILKAEWNYKNGKLNGVSRSYYESGELETEENYKNGKQEGITKWYYESGKLKYEWNYKNGKQVGIYKLYSESGNIELEARYNENGKKEGVEKIYDSDGQLMAETTYEDGKKHGKKKMYAIAMNGILIAEENYEDDKPEGIWKEYWMHNGALMHVDTYVNGIRINRRYYNMEGNFIRSQDF